MSDRESDLEQNPYLRSFYQHPPAPAARPINTNRGPNPYEPDQGTRHMYDQSRLGTYSRHSEADMMRLSGRPSSDLVAAATGPSPFPKIRSRAAPIGPSPLGTNRRAQNESSDESPQPHKSTKSQKRRYTERESSSDLSDLEEGDFSPALKRRLAPTPMKQRKLQANDDKRKSQQQGSDDDYIEESRDGSKEVDKDAEEEEALERLLAERTAQGYVSPTYGTPSGRSRKRGAPTTPMNGMVLYRTPIPAYNSANLLQKKPKGKPVPQTLLDADPADRMMWRWKTAGRPWEEIRDEYFRLSGTKPAASSLSVRYIKLSENLAANGFKDEVALTRAVVDARHKTASTLWKEVVVQMKSITGEDFAPASLRRRYEEIETQQFFISEQDPAKYNLWPALPRAKRGRRANFDSSQELVPVAKGSFDMVDHAHGRGERTYNMSTDSADESLFTDRSIEDAEYDSYDKADGHIRSTIDGRDEGGNMKRNSHPTFEKENESPSHTHPRISYDGVEHAQKMTTSGSMSMIPSTPTPMTAVGRAATGMGGGVHSLPRLGLAAYDSDGSD